MQISQPSTCNAHYGCCLQHVGDLAGFAAGGLLKVPSWCLKPLNQKHGDVFTRYLTSLQLKTDLSKVRHRTDLFCLTCMLMLEWSELPFCRC